MTPPLPRGLAMPRWAISFADLGLLLLGCFVMLHALELTRSKAEAASPVAAGPVSALMLDVPAADLFGPGDARLTGEGRARLKAIGAAAAARGAGIRIQSAGSDPGGRRFDAFELSAARAASSARALQSGGLAEGAVAILVAGGPGAQQMRISEAELAR